MVLLYTERLRNWIKRLRLVLYGGEMYYGVYSDIFFSLPANCFIRKPIEIEEWMNRLNEIIADDTTHQEYG